MKKIFYKFRQAQELKRLARENQGKALSVLDDVVFKAMLSADNEDSREALRSLLSACTHREVSSVQVINNDLVPAYLDAKTARLDVHVTFNDGESADLEMQAGKSDDDIGKRAIYYSAMLLGSQQSKGKSYKHIKRVYQVFFLNCVLFPESSKLPRRYFYQEEEENDRLSELTEIIFYELPKLENRMRDVIENEAGTKTLTDEEKWCIFMRYRHENFAGALIKRLCQEEEGLRAEKAVNKVSRDLKKYSRKMGEIKNSMDRASEIERAQEEAQKEGLAKGVEQGMAQGLEQGLTKGIETVARNALTEGAPIEFIQKITGLDLDVIKKIQANLR